MPSVRVDIDFDIPPELKQKIEENSEQIAEMVANEARATTAFTDKTGRLRRSIKAKRQKGEWVIEARAPHAFIVEHGHGGPTPAPAHAFLRPAMYNTIFRIK